MNTNEQTPTSTPIEATLRRHVDDARRAIRRTRIVAVIALALVSIWLTWLHSQIASIDAEGMATLAGERAKAALPATVAQLRSKLEESAPELVGKCKERLLEAPAQLREKLEVEADVWFDVAAKKLQAAFEEHVDLDVASVRAEIANRYPDMGEKDQLRALIDDYAHQYREQAWAAISGPASDSQRIFGELADHIAFLSLGEGLTERERIEREMLATLVELAPRLEVPERPQGYAFSLDRLTTPRQR